MTSPIPDPFAQRPRRTWRRVSIEVPSELTDAAAALLVEVSGAGVEILPADPGPDGGGRERILGYLVENEGAGAAEAGLRGEFAALEQRAGCAGAGLVHTEPILEEDWGAGWKRHFQPFHAAPRLVIKPSWESYEPQAGEAVIEMDPGLAFGTGLHASTRLALGFIEELCAVLAPERVLDLGTGSGILALAAALQGAGRVRALDSDPDAVTVARANAARNRLEERVSVGGEGLDTVAGPFDLVAANITADVLLALAPQIAARLAPAGALVLSGLLAGDQAREVRASFERLGLVGALERVEGEWAALLLFAGGSGSTEEVFEVCDEQGRVVGRAPRSACHRNPALIHRVAHVAVVDGGGRIYLQKRPRTKDVQPGLWDTSVGGHLDRGEDHEAGARREMLEELGLSGELRPLYRYLWRTERETELVATFLHAARAEPRPHPAEIDEGRWFTLAEAEALVFTGAATANLAEELRRLAAAGVLREAAGKDPDFTAP